MAGKGPVEIIVEGKNINDMSWPVLQRHIVEMVFALVLEKGERTKTRKECDMMRTCLENAEKDLEEANANLLKKYMEGDVLWERHKQPYVEKEQEITYQKFIINYDIQFQAKEDKKRLELVNAKWNKEVLPKMMAAKTREAKRFDEKQKEITKECIIAQREYQRTLGETVRKLEDKLLDWRLKLYKRLSLRNKYNDFQFLLKQLSTSEQKNLLIHDLNVSHKINFEKARSFIKERIEGDMEQIMALNQQLANLTKNCEVTTNEIERYKGMIERKQKELGSLKKEVKLCELKLTTYKQNIDTAIRCEKRINKLLKDKSAHDKRKLELEEEVKTKENNKQTYVNLIKDLEQQVTQLQKKYFGNDFENVVSENMENLQEFDDLFDNYEKEAPHMVALAKQQFKKEKHLLKSLPLMITREIKSHNDFIKSAMVKLTEMRLEPVPTFLHVTSNNFPTGTGPAGLTRV